MNFNLKNWMDSLDDNLKVLEINIPGAHDCATEFVQTSIFSKCQDKNISKQLNCGVRSLDVRVAPKRKELVLVHSKAKVFKSRNRFEGKMKLDTLLENCYDFLNENPSETIIFQFKNDSNERNDEKCFDNLFYTYIKKNESRWFLENRVPTLKEARGKLVLLRRCFTDTENLDYKNKSGLDLSRWLDQDKAVPEPLLLRTFSKDFAEILIQDRYKYTPLKRWDLCIKPFFEQSTPFNNQYVINYLSTAGGLKGPQFNSKIINEKFCNYELKKENYYGIIYFDFVSGKLTKKIIETNF